MKALSMLANIRLEWKRLAATNALVYDWAILLTAVIFYRRGNWGGVHKMFYNNLWPVL